MWCLSHDQACFNRAIAKVEKACSARRDELAQQLQHERNSRAREDAETARVVNEYERAAVNARHELQVKVAQLVARPDYEQRLEAEVTRLLAENDRLQRELTTTRLERPLTITLQKTQADRDKARAMVDVMRSLVTAVCDHVDYARKERHPGHAAGCGDVDVATFTLEELGPAVDAYRAAVAALPTGVVQ